MDPIEKRFPGHIRRETGKKKSGARTTSLTEVEHWSIIVLQWWQGPCCRRGREPVGNVHAAPSHFDDSTSHTRFFGNNKAHSRRINMQRSFRQTPDHHPPHSTHQSSNQRVAYRTVVLRSLDQLHSKGQSPLSSRPRSLNLDCIPSTTLCDEIYWQQESSTRTTKHQIQDWLDGFRPSLSPRQDIIR
jgi:hypothetical protein